MSQYYADAITQQSEALLRRLRELVPQAVVLGGWAVYLYADGQRSKDVDIAVVADELGALQREFGARLRRNDQLRKYEVVLDSGIELDIFVAFVSNSGIAIERVMDCSRPIAGYRVLCPEGLLLLKLCAWLDRIGRPKGDKDEIDIVSLLASVTIDWERYRGYVALAGLWYREKLVGAIRGVLISVTQRGNWARMTRKGAPAYANERAWRAQLEAFRTIIPSGV